MTAPVSCVKKPCETAIVKMPNATRIAQITSRAKFVIAPTLAAKADLGIERTISLTSFASR